MMRALHHCYILEGYAPTADKYRVYTGITTRSVGERVSEHLRLFSGIRGLFHDLEQAEAAAGSYRGIDWQYQVVGTYPSSDAARRIEHGLIALLRREHGSDCINRAA